jgi:uncharacterized repeat protein (TIGR04138 family)
VFETPVMGEETVPSMRTFRDHMAEVLARDPRYTIEAYAFVYEALEYTKRLRNRSRGRGRSRAKPLKRTTEHVDGRELCEGARRLALDSYGMLALTVLERWGLRTTSDIGEVVYNLIASGHLLKTPSDARSDFDDVFDFDQAFRRGFQLTLDEVA